MDTSVSVLHIGNAGIADGIKATYKYCGQDSEAETLYYANRIKDINEKFICFEIEIENLNSEDVAISSINFTCSADGEEVVCCQRKGTDSLFLSQGQPETIRLYYEVYEDAKDIKLVLDGNEDTDADLTFCYE